jgi:hypothetical protein
MNAKRKSCKRETIDRIDVAIAVEIFLQNDGKIIRLAPQSTPTTSVDSYNRHAYMDDDADKFLMEPYA